MTDRPSYTFIGRCDELAAELLHAFDDTARDITARTARRHLGPATWRALEQRLGYVDDRGRPPNSALRLATDWAVRFELGLWCGERALNVRWSAYHHIFVRGGDC